MKKSAVISDCGFYRYQLERIWDDSKPLCMFIMLNPSTADADKDDATIRRCITFAERWGYGGILVDNLFALRSTDPKCLLSVSDALGKDPIGTENIIHCNEMAKRASMVVCAWGNSPTVNKLLLKHKDYKPFFSFNKALYYLELSNDGTPKHPLYLKKELTPIKYSIIPAFRNYI